VTCKTSAAVVKTLTNYEQLALSKTKSKPKLLQGFISPVHFLCCCHGKHIESTVPTDSQVMTKKTFPVNHSLACASYAIYLAIHTCILSVKKAEK